MKKIIYFLSLFFLFTSAVYADIYNWEYINESLRQSTDRTTAQAVGISDDGETIMYSYYDSGDSDGKIYLTTNGGTSWTEQQPAGAVEKQWRAIAVSGDGDTLLAGAHNDRLYVSTNAGSSWAEAASPAGGTNRQWYNADTDSDGSHSAAVVHDTGSYGYCFYSTNSTTSWSQGSHNRFYTSAALSSNGYVGCYGRYANTRVEYSIAGLGSFSYFNLTGTAPRVWGTGAAGTDSNGWILIPEQYENGTAGGRVWMKKGSGGSVTEYRPIDDNDYEWYAGDIASDKSIIGVIDYDSDPYFSVDGGSTWTQETSLYNSGKSLRISNDGTYAVFMRAWGQVYKGTKITGWSGSWNGVTGGTLNSVTSANIQSVNGVE